MYRMDVHVMRLDELERRLGNLAPAAKDIMKTAVNETAKEARNSLVDRARKTYMVKRGAFNKSMKLKKATKSSLTATLHTAGKPIALRGFAFIKHDVETGEPVKAHQLRGRRNVPLVIDGMKTFYARMKTGHTGLFHRVKGSSMKHYWKKNEKGKMERKDRRTETVRGEKRDLKPREQITEKFGSSIPVMLGGTRVYDKTKPKIEETLQKKLENYTEQVLRRI